jgi:hypothetical protein
MTFEDTFDRQKIAMPTNLQILNQVELVKAIGVESIKDVINQLVVEGQSNLGL